MSSPQYIDILAKKNIKESLIDIISKNDFKNYEIRLNAGSKKGDNFVGEVYKVQITGTKKNNENETVNLFLKIPQQNVEFRNNFRLRDSFVREAYVYETLLPEFKKFENEKDVKKGFTSYCQCWKTSIADFDEFLIMEDLSEKGFVMFSKLDVLDFNHVALIMEELGKFHAFSFALKDQKPALFGELQGNITELFLTETLDPSMTIFVDIFWKSSVNDVKVEGVYKEKWEKFHENYFHIMSEIVKAPQAEPYAVINHGDFWNNNTMYKYKEGLPTEVKFLDWQLTRYSSPILDIMYFIFLSTEKPLRDAHYTTFLKIYYDSLSRFMRYLGSDPEKMFPYSEFQNQLKNFGKFGLIMAVMLVPSIMTRGDETSNVVDMAKDSSLITSNDSNKAARVKRLSDIVRDIVDLGYL